MVERKISLEIMEYMVWVIEIVANKFFNKDKGAAYSSLLESGLWDIYINHYDTTHTLGKEAILDEVTEYFTEHGVKTLC